MTNPFRGALVAALTATMPLAVLAQATATASAPSRSASSPAAATRSATSASGATYTSAFDGYRRFDDQKVQPWRESNDNVGRIGGWRAYAREAAGTAEATPQADHSQHQPSANPAPMHHDAHKGHGGHAMPKKP